MNRFKKTEEKKWILIGIASLIMVIIFLAVRLFSSNNMIVEETQNIMTSSTTLESTEVISDRTDDMFVDIKGAVKNPGIYQVTGNMRVLNVVELAGGFLSEADDKQVNLSERVVDQMVIYIPKEGEKLEDLSLIKANEKSEQESSKSDLINLNTATIDELKTLNGIGEKKAESIIRYREEKGLFKAIEDLKNVDGIGEKTFENLKSSLTI
ncbi:helix-hairpin-helix domain-containing protein [Vagococcus bubulae]|uniref:Helix-hairpin-helix DNA-binding motif class 1 domain-containing protein n=1 Tax=Vagococcus bubulae TaxID=1977868 RepID=A0A429ZQQ0_9ENTE|nr:helix-hairpin-helix domain-containing protein [Vagococcus bubulae]RST95978.1 hypothetical protein CBF36_02075 [Vagococcus bubulae]